MIEKFRLLLSGDKAREKLRTGMDTMVDIVKSTLGSHGRNVLIDDRARTPRITNDGFYIAREIILEDEIENLGAQAIVNTAKQTNRMVGDGTSTTMVLAQAIINKVFKRMGDEGMAIDRAKSVNVRDIYNQIHESEEKVVEELKKMAKPIKTQEDLEKVAIVAMGQEKMGKIVAEMRHKFGREGHINIEDAYGWETKTQTIQGMKFVGTYLTEALADERGQCIIHDPVILITNREIELVPELQEAARFVLEKAKKNQMVVITGHYAKQIQTFVNINLVRGFRCVAIKAPALGPAQFEDIAVFTGGTFYDVEKGEDFNKAERRIEEFGRAKKIMVDKDNVFIMEGKGNKNEIEQRIKDLKVEKEEKRIADPFKKKIEQRIASLSGGIGQIEVGSRSDADRSYLHDKVEDTDFACKAAQEEGVVPGGGLALKGISEKMDKDDILKGAIEEPYEQIQRNAGGDLKIGPEILDPLKVVRTSLENACAFAAAFITVDSAVAWPQRLLDKELKRLFQDTSLDEPA